MTERTLHARSRSLRPTTLRLLHTIHRASGCSYSLCNLHFVYVVPCSFQSPRARFRPHHAGEQQAAAATLNCMTSRLGYRPCVQFAIAALASVHEWLMGKPPWVLYNLSLP